MNLDRYLHSRLGNVVALLALAAVLVAGIRIAQRGSVAAKTVPTPITDKCSCRYLPAWTPQQYFL